MGIEPGGRSAAWIVAGVAALLAIGFTVALTRAPRQLAQCGPGFVAVGAHCTLPAGAGAGGDACPAPLVLRAGSCDAPDTKVAVPAVVAELGPSDWEAEGRVAARTVRTAPFLVDAFEATVGHVFCESCPLPDPSRFAGDIASRAASGLSLDEARAVCRARGGRVPTGDEWTALSAFTPASAPVGDASTAPLSILHRYPWGDTGAVCRRAAWGISRGPCASGARGADPVGAHADGASPAGVFDLAGNVAEWTDEGFVRGGSWDSALAEELRTWARAEVPALAHDPRNGVRCVYDAPPAIAPATPRPAIPPPNPALPSAP